MRKHLTEEHKKAWNSYRAQQGRCYRKKDHHYRNYGGKGIKIEYSLEDFIEWWILNQNSNYIKDATVSRLDHNGNYSFNNIILESRSDNSKERNARNPQGIKVDAISLKGEHFATFKDSYEAAKFYDIAQSSIWLICSGRYKKSRKLNGITFRQIK